MGALQPMHLIIVFAIVLLIFGPGKLPELGRAIGDGMRELKRASDNNTVAAPRSETFCGNCGRPGCSRQCVPSGE